MLCQRVRRETATRSHRAELFAAPHIVHLRAGGCGDRQPKIFHKVDGCHGGAADRVEVREHQHRVRTGGERLGPGLCVVGCADESAGVAVPRLIDGYRRGIRDNPPDSLILAVV